MKGSRQVADTQWKAGLLSICLVLSASWGVPSSAGGRSSDGPGEDIQPVEASSSRRLTRPEDFSRVWRELETLRVEDLLKRADELWLIDPDPVLRAMILRVGREIPGTSTATRRSERLEIREAAVKWIRKRIDEDPKARELWEDEVRDILADSSQVIQWCATARALGRLGEYGLARELAQRLDSKNPRLVLAVRLALHDLYLRWFEDTEEFEAFWPEAHQVCQDSIFMETARERDTEARETLIDLLGYEPQRAEVLLSDADPRLRAAAAAVLGRAHNGDIATAVEMLLAHAASETDGAAFQASLDGLLLIRGAAPAEDPDMVRLREMLERRIDQGYADLQAPIADALRRLPWSEADSGESSLLKAIDLLVGQITRLVAPHRLTDRDVVVTSLYALENLASRAQKAGLDTGRSLDPMNAMVIGMIEDDLESDVVRIGASKLLPLVGDAESLARAAVILGARQTSPVLAYNLLAALGEMAAALAPEDPAAELVLATLLERLKGDDANLRRRALSYLEAEKLSALVAGADPRAFIDSLGRETVPELQTQLLDLIARLGGAEQLDALVALPSFDGIVGSGPAVISSLAQTLQALAGDSGNAQLHGATRLLSVENEASRILRLRLALGMVSALLPETLTELSARQNHSIVLWAAELREAAGSLPGGESFLGRLNRLHLPACRAGNEAQDSRELAHVQALFLSDWLALDPEAGTAEEVLEHFSAALAYAAESQDSAQSALVLRDRARFHLASGNEVAALIDYRTLFERELPAMPVEAGSPPPGSPVLELRDLRRGSELLVTNVDEGEPDRGAVREALRVSLLLVQEVNWKLEPAAVRTQDLRDLAERALLVGEPEGIETVAGLLSELPGLLPDPIEGEPVPTLPSAPEGALWAGLIETQDLQKGLLELRAGLLARLTELRERPDPIEPEDQVEPEQGGDKPADQEGPEGTGEGVEKEASTGDEPEKVEEDSGPASGPDSSSGEADGGLRSRVDSIQHNKGLDWA